MSQFLKNVKVLKEVKKKMQIVENLGFKLCLECGRVMVFFVFFNVLFLCVDVR